MKFKTLTVLGFSVLLLAGCSKPKQDATANGAASPAGSTSTTAQTAPTTSVSGAAAETKPSEIAPTSFAAGTKETVENAVGLGCETRSLQGWLEVLCRKKNGTGGNPVAAFRIPTGTPEEIAKAELEHEGGEETPTFVKAENGELRMVLPFVAGQKDELRVDWTDVSYTLKIDGATARFDWAANTLELRKACAALTEESKAVLKNAQKPGASEGVTTGEIGKMTRFGLCQPAGRGAWALALKNVHGTGTGAERKIVTELELVRVDESGKRISTPLATFTSPAGALALGRLTAYDYDADGKNEALFSYEFLSGPASVEPPNPQLVWSFTESEVVPYVHGLKALPAGATLEQLDPDMRPDFGSASPFEAFLDAQCGAKKCPARLTGPKFFSHSLANGEFSTSDEAARAAVKRACGKKLETVVATNGTGANLERTAHNIGCARAYQVPAETITKQLEDSRAKLCTDATNCPVMTTLLSWAKLDAPTQLD